MTPHPRQHRRSGHDQHHRCIYVPVTLGRAVNKRAVSGQAVSLQCLQPGAVLEWGSATTARPALPPAIERPVAHLHLHGVTAGDISRRCCPGRGPSPQTEAQSTAPQHAGPGRSSARLPFRSALLHHEREAEQGQPSAVAGEVQELIKDATKRANDASSWARPAVPVLGPRWDTQTRTGMHEFWGSAWWVRLPCRRGAQH